jgi:hypothetical protein
MTRRERVRWSGLAVLILGALLLRLWLGGEVPAPPPPVAVGNAGGSGTAATHVAEGPVVAGGYGGGSRADVDEPPPETEPEPEAQERDIGEDMQAIADAVRQHHQQIGPLPPGGNAAATAALTGANAQGLMFIPPDHPAVRGGLLVDGWGTPFLIQSAQPDEVEIRSAGTDRVFNTEDDQAWILTHTPEAASPATPPAEEATDSPDQYQITSPDE